MSIKTLLFDLDGTLLPMDQELFIKAYIGGLVKAAAPKGYEPAKMADAIMSGTVAMVKNNGEKKNEDVFWDEMVRIYGEDVMSDLHIFDEFYKTEFQNVSKSCGFQPKAAELIRLIKDKGLHVSLATNPLFPAIATESRIRWAGLEPEDFEYFTTYENSYHCKPNLEYYKDVIAYLNVDPSECLMVGNDVGEDMVASKLGMSVFLLTDCLINRKNEDISQYPHGCFDDLMSYIAHLNE